MFVIFTFYEYGILLKKVPKKKNDKRADESFSKAYYCSG